MSVQPFTAKKPEILILLLLAAAMAATRVNHFGFLPDASWAVFFIAGFYLRHSTRFVFPSLMILAVVIDYLVITQSGQSFWTHYCVSPAYWLLAPAYFVMWAMGAQLKQHYSGLNLKSLGLLAIYSVVAVMGCHLIAQGSFYWIAKHGGELTVSGWMSNYIQWLPGYLSTTLSYIGVASVLHYAVNVYRQRISHSAI